MIRERLYYSYDISGYDFGRGHPFRGDRFIKFMCEFERRGWDKNIEVLEAREAKIAELLTVHTKEYIDMVLNAEKKGNIFLSPDTYVLPGMVRAVRLMVGSALQATEDVLGGQTDHGITFGGLHHAHPNHGEGFCLFNDVAIAAMRALELGAKCVANIDTDAHHGNGTMDIFYDRCDVLYISLHQDPSTLYPGRGYVHEIGSGEGKGYTINVPLSPGATEADYFLVMDEVVFPVVEDYKPDIVYRNGGSDIFAGDVLTDLGVSMCGLYELGHKMREFFLQRIKTKWVDMIASGYGPDIVSCWLCLFAGICGLSSSELEVCNSCPQTPKQASVAPLAATKRTVAEIKRQLSPYWHF